VSFTALTGSSHGGSSLAFGLTAFLHFPSLAGLGSSSFFSSALASASPAASLVFSTAFLESFSPLVSSFCSLTAYSPEAAWASSLAFGFFSAFGSFASLASTAFLTFASTLTAASLAAVASTLAFSTAPGFSAGLPSARDGLLSPSNSASSLA